MKVAWEDRALLDVVDVVGGGTPSTKRAEYWNGSIPWVSPKDMKGSEVTDLEDHITEQALSDSPASIVKAGAVLVVVRSGILARTVPLAIAMTDLCINQDLKALVPRPSVTSKFLYLALQAQASTILAMASRGATVHRLPSESLMGLRLRVPAIPEQDRLVAALDEAFEAIAMARAHTEQNLRNARELFDSNLNSVLTHRGDGWLNWRLGDVCSIARGGSPRPIKQFITTRQDGINWVKIGDATASGKFIYRTEEKIIPEGAKRSRIVHDGDFLLSNSMSFGRPYIMRTTGCIHDGWLVLSDYMSSLDQDYLYYVLGSQFMYEQFDRLAAGSTVRNLNIELASQVGLPIPPLERQREIAKQLGALSAETERLASSYQRKIAALDALKQSLLHQAFTGAL